MEILILGYQWHAYLLENEDFNAKFSDCSAITLTDTQEIYLKKECFRRLHVAHEVTHAFKFYTCMEELELTEEQHEEVLCDFTALHGQKIHEITTMILDHFNKG